MFLERIEWIKYSTKKCKKLTVLVKSSLVDLLVCLMHLRSSDMLCEGSVVYIKLS